MSSNIEHPTNEDEGEANEEGQGITTKRFIVLPITLCKHTQAWIDVILAESLQSNGIWHLVSESGRMGLDTALNKDIGDSNRL